MNSVRFPRKALAHLYDDTSMLSYLIQRLQAVPNIDDICICTTEAPEDDILESYAHEHNVHVYRGSEHDVVARMLGAADLLAADTVIRITGDNPLTACDLLAQHIDIHRQEELDFSRFVGLPLGMTADCISVDALRECSEIIGHKNSEYFLFTMFDPELFRCGVLRLEGTDDLSSTSVTVDTPPDLERIRNILLSHAAPQQITTEDVLSYIQAATADTYEFGSTMPVRTSPTQSVSYGEFLADMQRRIRASNAYSVTSINVPA